MVDVTKAIDELRALRGAVQELASDETATNEGEALVLCGVLGRIDARVAELEAAQQGRAERREAGRTCFVLALYGLVSFSVWLARWFA